MPTTPPENDPLAGLVGGRARPRRPDMQQVFDVLQRQAPEQAKVVTAAGGLKLALIPAGTFLMGSPDTEPGRRENESPHEVTLTRAFYLGVCPITQEQFAAVTGRNPAHFHAKNGGGPQHPVESVSWDEAVAFCERLSALPGERAAGRNYRLPTEAEWEYACRAGTRTAFAGGDELGPADANIAADGSPGQTTPVGAYRANLFGLCDLHGNVWEWCADWYRGGYYRASPPRDPAGPEQGEFRVLRGGSWRSQPATCRAAYRNALAPHHRDRYTGFRVVAITV
jgi:formylglycine-generating enzyme required for sulfatase activity